MAKTVKTPACQTAQMNGRSVARIATIVMGSVAALSLAGLIWMMVASSGDYDEFGEVPIPGSALIELPEGRVVVSFNVTASGRGTAVPPLTLSIEPPPGGRDPDVVDDLGDSVAAGNDIHRRVWVMQVPAAGRYPVSIDGPVADFENPKLTFGRDGGLDGAVWVLVALSVISTDLAIAGWWFQRRGRTTSARRDSCALTEDESEGGKRRILE